MRTRWRRWNCQGSRRCEGGVRTAAAALFQPTLLPPTFRSLPHLLRASSQLVVNHLKSGVKDLNALGLLCLLLDRNLFHGKLVSSRPDDRIVYDNDSPGIAPQLRKAGGSSGPFATVLVAPLDDPGSMETQFDVLLEARLRELDVADIREDVRKGCFVKLTDGQHKNLLLTPKFEPLGKMPNCWEVSRRSKGTTAVNVDILPPEKIRSAAGMEQVAAEKLGAELVDAVLEQAEAESTISAAVGSFWDAKKAKEDGHSCSRLLPRLSPS